MSSLCSKLLFGSAVLLLPCFAPGQVAQTPSSETPALSTTTRLVLVDVVVTSHDSPLRGLKQNQFHIFENGRDQPIVSFEEHQAPHPPGSALPIQHAAPEPATYTNIPDYPQTGAATALLLDGLNTPLENMMQVRHELVQYLAAIPPGTPIALYTLSGKFRMVTGFSSDIANHLQRPYSTRHRP
jgi:VWFA-related protein